MKIEGSLQELEQFFKKFRLKGEMESINSMPPHEFPFNSPEKYQQLYKEAQPKAPKEEKY